MNKYDVRKLFSVEQCVAVITGGGTGIGRMMAEALAANGAARVYIIGRREDKLRDVAKSFNNVIPLVGDVTSKDSLSALAAKVASEVGYVNLLIANSGVAGPSVQNMPKNPSLTQFKDFVWNWSTEEYTNTYHVNNTAVFFTAVAFLELLDAGNKKQNMEGVSSQILITASIASYIRIVVSGYAYVTSKAAATHLTKCLATQFAPYGIRCNALAPGFYPSEMTEIMLDKVASSQGAAVPHFDKGFIPLERAGTPEDMGGTILWLASRAAAYISGTIIVTDGGRLSIVPAAY